MSKKIILKNYTYIPAGSKLIYEFNKIGFNLWLETLQSEYPSWETDASEDMQQFGILGPCFELLNLDTEIFPEEPISIEDRIEFSEENVWRSIINSDGTVRPGCIKVLIPKDIVIEEQFYEKFTQIGLDNPYDKVSQHADFSYVIGNLASVNTNLLSSCDQIYGSIFFQGIRKFWQHSQSMPKLLEYIVKGIPFYTFNEFYNMLNKVSVIKQGDLQFVLFFYTLLEEQGTVQGTKEISDDGSFNKAEGSYFTDSGGGPA